jgi:hypothetical protein
MENEYLQDYRRTLKKDNRNNRRFLIKTKPYWWEIYIRSAFFCLLFLCIIERLLYLWLLFRRWRRLRRSSFEVKAMNILDFAADCLGYHFVLFHFGFAFEKWRLDHKLIHMPTCVSDKLYMRQSRQRCLSQIGRSHSVIFGWAGLTDPLSPVVFRWWSDKSQSCSSETV